MSVGIFVSEKRLKVHDSLFQATTQYADYLETSIEDFMERSKLLLGTFQSLDYVVFEHRKDLQVSLS